MSRAPYKYLDYYTFEDADLFFGREEETQRMVGEILSARLLVLFSPSGSGKTSLINAGVRPQLENMGYQTIYTRLETEPISSVCNAVASALEIPCDGNIQSLYEFLKTVTSRTEKPLVIFLDQFEEFFTVFRERHEKRKDFIDQLAKIKYDDHLPVFVALSVREDYIAKFEEFKESIPSIFQNTSNLHLESLSIEAARRAIEEPLKVVNYAIEKEVVNHIINDLKDDKQGIEPIKLQIICYTLWNKRRIKDEIITLSLYRSCGGVKRILNNHIADILKKIPNGQEEHVIKIFEDLKTPEMTRLYRSFPELLEPFSTIRIEGSIKIKKFRAKTKLTKILNKLTQLDLLRCENKDGLKWYEIKHEYLLEGIIDWIEKSPIRKSHFNFFTFFNSLIFLLLIYFLLSLFWYSIRFSDQKYIDQQREILVKNSFPFPKIVTTGYLENELKKKLIDDVNNGDVTTIGEKRIWDQLTEIINLEASIKILYHTGRQQAAIDTLLKMMMDESSDVRYQAILIIENLDLSEPEVIEALIKAIKDESPLIRSRAAITLSKIGQIESNELVLTALLKTLKDSDPSGRAIAARVLGDITVYNLKVIDGLLAALKDNNSEVRLQAVKAFGNLGTKNDQIIQGLQVLLKDKDNNVRLQTALALGNMGIFNTSVVNSLIAVSKDNSPVFRIQAIEALGNNENTNSQIVDALLKALIDKDIGIRIQAARSLVNVGRYDDLIITTLLKMLNENDTYYVSQSINILINIGKTNSKIIDLFLKKIREGDWKIRSNVALILGKLGSGNLKVIQSLILLLKDDSSSVRASAIEALGNQKNFDSLLMKELMIVIKDENPNVRAKTAAVLGKISKADENLINELVYALKDQEWIVRSQAVVSLGQLDTDNENTYNALRSALKDEDFLVRSQAAWALGMIGKFDECTIDSLIALLTDRNYDVQSEAKSALGRIYKSTAVLELFKCLQNNLSGYRTAGAQALAQQDSITDSILEEVNRLKDKDKRPWVRLGAWQAYELIQERLANEKAANQFIHKADSLFQINKFWEADNQYQSAFDQLTKIIRIDSLKIARTKFQQARCTARMKRLIPTLDHLEIAFQYNKVWRDTLRAELAQKGSEWEFMKENWYLKEVLLKNSKSQITNSKPVR